MCIVHCALNDIANEIWVQGNMVENKILHDTIEHAAIWVCVHVCLYLFSTLSSIVTCFAFAYEFIHRLSYIIHSQKLLNRTQHPIAIFCHEIKFLGFTAERLSQNHINIVEYILVFLNAHAYPLFSHSLEFSFHFSLSSFHWNAILQHVLWTRIGMSAQYTILWAKI